MAMDGPQKDRDTSLCVCVYKLEGSIFLRYKCVKPLGTTGSKDQCIGIQLDLHHGSVSVSKHMLPPQKCNCLSDGLNGDAADPNNVIGPKCIFLLYIFPWSRQEQNIHCPSVSSVVLHAAYSGVFSAAFISSNSSMRRSVASFVNV